MKKWFILAMLLLCCQGVFSRGIPPRYPVVLVEFKDVRFQLEDPASLVKDLLTKPGFNYDGANGSVTDYYRDNLGDFFAPSFDVYGPVTLEGRLQDYGRDVFEQGERVGDKAPEEALLKALEALSLDPTAYDADGDGAPDLAIMVYAGYDQAAGASADAIWAHQGSVASMNYIAVPELSGASGSHLGGIGLVCHELGHYLGLPDFYDTDFAMGGNAGGVYGFSLMGKGLYNNDGHTPPSLNALEKSLIGLQTDIPPLPEGVVRLGPGEMYRSETATEGEYFLYEYRDGKGWDAPLPRGLVIYHVDRSGRKVGDYTAEELWINWRNFNGVNSLASHPCYRLVPSFNPWLLEFDAALAQGRMVFPGLDEVLFYEPVDWEGNYTGVQITGIGLGEDGVSFRVLRDAGANLNGTVRDADGHPLEGVTVRAGDVSACTGADGFFCLELPEGALPNVALAASLEGYQPYYEEVSMGKYRMKSLSVTLRRADAPRESTLSPYDTEASMGYFANTRILGGVHLSPEELYPYVGQELGEVVFYPYMTSAFDGEVYLVVDVEGRRVLTRKLENLVKGPYCKQVVDLSGEHIVIPEGMSLYIGYGSPAEDSDLNFRVGTVYPAAKGRSCYSPFSLLQSSWQDMFVKSAGIYMDVALTVTAVENTQAKDLVELGYSYIERPQGKIKAGERIPLKLHAPDNVISVNWMLDTERVNGEFTPALKAGTHRLQARITHREGIEEVLEVLLKVD